MKKILLMTLAAFFLTLQTSCGTTDPDHDDPKIARVEILEPADGSVFSFNQQIPCKAEAEPASSELVWWVSGILVKCDNQGMMPAGLSKGEHTVIVEAHHSDLFTGRDEVKITIE